MGQRSRFVKIILISLLVLAVAAGALLLYWNLNKKKIVRNKIEKVIREKSNGLYKVHYADMQMDEISGNASFSNMDIVYHDSTYLSLKEKPPILLNIHIPSVNIFGVKTPKAMQGKEIVGRVVELNDPYIEIIYTGNAKQSKNLPSKELYEEILGNLDLIQMDTVAIHNATIVTKHLNRKDSIVFKNMTITLANVAVDSLSKADDTRILFARTMELRCEKITWTEAAKRYAYTISNISYNSDNTNMYIQDIAITPQLPEDAFVKSLPFQADRFDMQYKNIKLIHVDSRALMNEVLIADVLNIGSCSIKAYRDLAIPRDTKNRSGTYLHQEIMKVPLPFVIRKVVCGNTFIQYREKNDITGMVGDVKFYDGNISIDNLTNQPSAIRKNNICRVDASFSFLHLTPVHTTLKLSLGDQQGRFSIEGSVGGGDATKLNVLTEPMALAKIRKGTIESLNFQLTGDNTRADGTVTILYEGLKMDLLEIDKGKAPDQKGLSSFVANIILKDDNPKKGETVRVAEVHHARDMNRSFYNLVWKSIMEGVNKSINNPKKMKRP